MIDVALKGLARRKLRALLTGLAVIIGVAMISGTYVLTDSISGAFGNIFSEAYRGADTVVSPKPVVDSDVDNTPTIPQSVVARIAARDDVAQVSGAVTSDVGARLTTKQGRPIDTKGAPALAMGIDPRTPDLAQIRVTSGRLADGAGEIVIDSSTAAKHGYALGDAIGVQTDSGTRRFTIVGLGTFGNASLGSATVAVFDLATAQQLLNRGSAVDEILVAAKPDVDTAALTAAIAADLPDDLEVRSGKAEAAAQTADVGEDLKFINYFLLTFAAIALFVGSFVIFNTLSITVAQRTRELATLRTLGASRRQVMRSVVLEAVVIGVASSIVGLVTGLGLAKGLNALFAALDVDLPSRGLVLEPRTVIVSLLVGTLVTMAASVLPARRASRIAPITAVREGSSAASAGASRRGLVVGGLAAIAGAGALVWSLLGDLTVQSRLTLMGVGLAGMFLGVAVLLPRAVRPMAHAVGAPFARIGGEAARLGRENTVRSPSRTAASAAALMIGLALMAFVAVLGSGLRQSSREALDAQLLATHVVAKSDGFENLTPGTDRAVLAAPGVRVSTGVRSGFARIGDSEQHVNGVDPAVIGHLYRFRWTDGSDARLAAMTDAQVIIDDDFARDQGLSVGASLRLTAAAGRTATFTVAAVAKPARFDPLLGAVVMTQAAFDRLSPRATDAYVLAAMDGNAGAASSALSRALADYPDAEVATREGFVESRSAGINQMLNLLYVLLALSVVVSMFGMLNTLALAVVERTREIGMLRAVGMSRRQVRGMIRSEGITTALIGAAMGLPIGVGLAALVTHALAEYDVGFSVPVGGLIGLAAAAILIGIAAATLPGRRAAWLDVLKALQYE